MAKILLASSQKTLKQMRAALSEHELLDALTIEQAETWLRQSGIDLIVIGIHLEVFAGCR